ncbi:TlpA disulfide reductase family protein [Congregibacter variabilis]|uniref:TlpA disulfide reductase family protein n=1 Tax=Congregibacter variabilis TaxID=3081200 RepID=A0ABZ0I135_9GAMM|nr:TlpA disulfide reductase family protein [Congregibacter sp. IMCC43200]
MKLRQQARLFLLLTALIASVHAGASEGEDKSSGWRLVNYWSEWCAPCRKEIPMLNALREELALSSVQLVGVNFDDDPRDVTLRIASSLGINFPTLTRKEVNEYGMPAPSVMPTTYIVSPANEVADTLIGLQSREQIVARLFRLGVISDAP